MVVVTTLMVLRKDAERLTGVGHSLESNCERARSNAAGQESEAKAGSPGFGVGAGVLPQWRRGESPEASEGNMQSACDTPSSHRVFTISSDICQKMRHDPRFALRPAAVASEIG